MNGKVFVVVAGLAAAVCGAWAGPEIDTSPDRVKTDLNPGLERIGTVKPRGTKEIVSSNWSLGCETVDRDYTD